MGKLPKPPLQPDPCTHSYLHPIYGRNELAPLRESASKGTYFFASSCSQHRSPSKPLLEFLVWSLVNFYWLGKSKHPGQYQFYCLRWFQDEKEHDLHSQGVEGLIGKHVTQGSEITTKKKGLRKLEELKDLLIGKRDRVSRRTWHLCWTSQDKSTGDTWDPHWNIYCVTGCLRHPSWKTKPEYIGDKKNNNNKARREIEKKRTGKGQAESSTLKVIKGTLSLGKKIINTKHLLGGSNQFKMQRANQRVGLFWSC